MFIDIAHNDIAPSPFFGRRKRRARNAAAAQPASAVQTAMAGSKACSRASVTPESAPKIRMGNTT